MNLRTAVTTRRLATVMLLVAAAAAVLGAWTLGDSLRPAVVAVLEWVHGLGAWGPAAVIAIYIVASIAMVPGSALTTGCGFLFGPLAGAAIASTGATLGAAAAFFVGRACGRPHVERWLGGDRRFQALDRAVAKRAFRVVLLTRLSPAFPFGVLNYSFGVTQVSFRRYLGATWLGMLPGALMYAYLGSTLEKFSELWGGATPGSGAERLGVAIGLLATAAATVLLTRWASEALRAEAHLAGDGPRSPT